MAAPAPAAAAEPEPPAPAAPPPPIPAPDTPLSDAQILQITANLDTGEIDAPILERAPRELARLRRTQSIDVCQRRHDRRNNRAATMQLELGDIFSGLASRSRKPERQRLIDNLAAWRTNAGKRSFAWIRNPAHERLKRRPGVRTRNTHDSNGSRRTSRGQCVNRVVRCI